MTPELLRKYAQPVPRYTSYPTAPHFVPSVTEADYRQWLSSIPSGSSISLYVHIPFCDRLCWYCGCTTKATQRYAPIADYLDTLVEEIRQVASLVPRSVEVLAVHLGGGSPSILSSEDIARLRVTIGAQFKILSSAELAVEIDPRHASQQKLDTFAAAGFNRVSLGVQDFNPDVQVAINRLQSFEDTAAAVVACRQAGIRSINIDLVYGLPKQTRASMADTVAQVIELAPDRIALFGYAHLPSRLVHQRLIRDVDLPGTVERFAQANRAANRLMEAGYVRVGLDHFARPADTLAQQTVHRNFQGYTSDAAPTLIGFGASAIGRLSQGYVQNASATGEYLRRVSATGLAIVRGRALDLEDKARGAVIETLLCALKFSVPDIRREFPSMADTLAAIGQTLIEQDQDHLVRPVGSDGSFEVTERGRVALRSICACFDAYLGESGATHTAGV